LVFEVRPQDLQVVANLVRTCMESAVVLRVPLQVKMSAGATWGSLEVLQPPPPPLQAPPSISSPHYSTCFLGESGVLEPGIAFVREREDSRGRVRPCRPEAANPNANPNPNPSLMQVAATEQRGTRDPIPHTMSLFAAVMDRCSTAASGSSEREITNRAYGAAEHTGGVGLGNSKVGQERVVAKDLFGKD
jgi:hypothetical protein